MPECNPCVVCGKQQSPPVQMGGAHPWQCFCYENPSDHSTMVSGRTHEEAVDRWNRLNPLPGVTPQPERGRGPFWHFLRRFT